MKSYIATILLSILFSTSGISQLQSPNEFFPTKRGEQFTAHHQLVDYFEHVAKESDRVKLITYGQTNQGRPLILAFISSEENIKNLEKIRINNMRLAGLVDSEKTENKKTAIVWLSYSIHGNEAGGSEASPEVLFDLVDPNNTEASNWLNNTVVIIDPSLNPDGYSRYTHWHRGIAATVPNANPIDIEHYEPWPGGRTNHYYFDLNRDWAWQTQIESQKRMEQYNQWLPHVHADLHEMAPTQPYYFAPAAEPYHEYITEWQRNFQIDIGKNHAAYFDKNGWLYFTKEFFDLFYPSYGDTYPTFNGSVGMTYEQGGHSRGGRAYATPNGEVLTLSDRIKHQKTTSMSTIEISAKNADILVDQFAKYFYESRNNPQGKYKSYVVKRDEEGHRLKALTELLDKQDIIYGSLKSSKSNSGLSYITDKKELFQANPGDLIISAYQSKSVLLQVLMDPESKLDDSITFDITAWALPHAYGLEAFALEKKLEPDTELAFTASRDLKPNAYAYAFKWNSVQSAKLVSSLLKEGIKLRTATSTFELKKQKFSPGTIVATQADNKKLGKSFFDKLNTVVENMQVDAYSISTGFTDSGPNLGSIKMALIKKPQIFTLFGDNAGSNSLGQIRHFFEQELAYPITLIDQDNWTQADLGKFNTFILADGFYQFSEAELKILTDWVNKGGKIIAIGNAVRSFADKPGFALTSYESEDAKKKADMKKLKEALENRYDRYEGEERRFISRQNQGAVVKATVDISNPLAFGLNRNYFSLKTNNLYYPLMTNAWNVIYTSKNPKVYGFIGAVAKETLKNSLIFGIDRKGKGQIIYLIDNPLYRGFWENGKLLFANSLFISGN